MSQYPYFKILSLCTVLLSVLCCSAKVFSQNTSVIQVSKDKVAIGDHIPIQVVITMDKNQNPQSIDLSKLLEMENLFFEVDSTVYEKKVDLEVISVGLDSTNFDFKSPISIDKLLVESNDNQKMWKLGFVVAIYNAGKFVLPPPRVLSSEDLDIIEGASPTIEVVLPMPLESLNDTLQINDIKGIILEPRSWRDFLPYLVGIGCCILLFLFGKRFFKRKKTIENKQVVEEIIQLQPHEVALQALQDLKNEELWQKGEILAYQSRLTNIIRNYIEDQFQIPANTLSTHEILKNWRSKNFDKKFETTIEQILQVADLVKFAKATPGDDIHDHFMKLAINFVFDTQEEINKASLSSLPSESKS